MAGERKLTYINLATVGANEDESVAAAVTVMRTIPAQFAAAPGRAWCL